MIRSMAKASVWAGPDRVFVCWNFSFAGPSDPKITVFITIQAPERLSIFQEFWNRYLIFIGNHKYTYFHKLNGALEIHDFS